MCIGIVSSGLENEGAQWSVFKREGRVGYEEKVVIDVLIVLPVAAAPSSSSFLPYESMPPFLFLPPPCGISLFLSSLGPPFFASWRDQRCMRNRAFMCNLLYLTRIRRYR